MSFTDLVIQDGILYKKLKTEAFKPINTKTATLMIKGVVYRIEDVFWYVYYGDLPCDEWDVRRIQGPGTPLTRDNLVRVMKYQGALSKEFIRSHFNYDPDTGALERKYIACKEFQGEKTWDCPYGAFSVCGVKLQAHVLVWWYMMGRKPGWDKVIDHKDGKPSNLKWANLREITQSQNMANWWSHRNHNQPLEI